ncbi:MAG: glycosyltransferase [Bacteroidia bacterium]
MASERIRVGLIYSFDTRWIAGTYYIVNLVHALNVLPDDEKPHIVILSFGDEGHDLLKVIQYPYIDFQSLNYLPPLHKRVINKLTRLISDKNIFRTVYSDRELNLIFPYFHVTSLSELTHKIYWIPDFQYEFLSSFFSEKELALRRSAAEIHAKKGPPLVLSSKDALSHFRKFYPDSESPAFVINFAVTHPNISGLDVKEVKKKYDIKGPYYFAPNQFWIHKNQIVILKAVQLLKEQGKKGVQIVFSGKEDDHRQPDYTKGLKKYAEEHGLGEQVSFLGFIDREDQLLLMKESIAVIQPSLFEGWSTVIEDAKAIGKYVLASDLDVHHEQLREGVDFFDPSDPEALAVLLCKYEETAPLSPSPDSYKLNRLKFGQDFMSMVHAVLKK